MAAAGITPVGMKARLSTQRREWIQEWLLKFLARYHGKSQHELFAAAGAGQFRYLGRLCKLRFIDELRGRNRCEDSTPS